MNINIYLKKFKEYGLKHCIEIIWKIRLDWIIQDIIVIFVRKKPLNNTIIIESHNDFDCNGGAFYEYLIKNNFNEKYKIVWLLKHPEKRPKKLPKNVLCYPLYKPSIKKDIAICTAKFLLADNVVTFKKRTEQKSFYMGHGTGGLKNIKGLSNIHKSVDYVLIQSKAYAPIQAEQYGLVNTPEKMIFIGYPIHDELLKQNKNEIKKITDKQYKKTILWMPTFRKCTNGSGYKRDDSNIEQAMGVPLIHNSEEYNILNDFLREHNILLIIKIHPMQDLSTLKIVNKSNIVVLTGDDVKDKGIDNYRLMRCVDALISDYSGAAYEFLQLNKPIGYVLDDMNDYKLGFVVDDIHTLLAGNELYNLSDMFGFLNEISNDIDTHFEKRQKIRNYIYEYHDTNNCERLAKFMAL